MSDFSQTWLNLLDALLQRGEAVAPRGKLTKELPQQTIHVDLRQPVLTVLQRKLSYGFMAAEAFWILTGDDRVETIAPYNKRIADFSDDGVRFFGAYGPKIVSQLPFVVQKLLEDPMSRQAGLTTWRENPPATKDVPCTIAMFFSIRDEKLNAHVFMRSSDAWLGVPYDVFNFAMVAHAVCAELNQQRAPLPRYEPGTLYLTMASSHLYQENFEAALECLRSADFNTQPLTPTLLWQEPAVLIDWLRELRDSKPGSHYRWWEPQL